MLQVPEMPNLLTSQPHPAHIPPSMRQINEQPTSDYAQPPGLKAQPPASDNVEPISSGEDARVYFGNVPYQITENEIRTFFEKCGEVKNVHMVRDKLSKRFQGYGFITFAKKEGQKAALLLNATMFRERKLKVNLETKAMPTKSGKRIFIKNIGVNTPDEEVKKQFEQFGTIEGFFTIKDKHTKQSKGFGFMDFSTADEAKAALEMDGKQAFGQTLTVSKAHNSRQENMASGHGGWATFRGAGWRGRGGFTRAYAPYESAPWERPSGSSGRARGYHPAARNGYYQSANVSYDPVGDANYGPKTGFGFANQYGAGSQQQSGWQQNKQQGGWQNQQPSSYTQGAYQNQQPSPYTQGAFQTQQPSAYTPGAFQTQQPSPYKQF